MKAPRGRCGDVLRALRRRYEGAVTEVRGRCERGCEPLCEGALKALRRRYEGIAKALRSRSEGAMRAL